jgi:hypothetical protein|nr:hypothetical protein [uncultured Flavobacterium sp.]
MKQILPLFLVLISVFYTYDLTGEYINPVGERIVLNSDKTFLHIFQLGHTAYWQKGKWKQKRNTLYLEPIIMYDTLRRNNMRDSLIVSRDMTPNLHIYIDDETVYEDSEFQKCQAKVNTTYSKYIFKKNRLIAVEYRGKLVTSEPKHELLKYQLRKNKSYYYDPSYVKINK